MTLAARAADAHELTRTAALARLAAADPAGSGATKPAAAPASVARLSITVLDAATGKPVPANVRIRLVDSKRYWKAPDPATSLGLYRTDEWYTYAPGDAPELPAEHVEIEAFRGVEWTVAKTTADLTGDGPHAVTLTISKFHDIQSLGWIAGNTHLHLQQVTRGYADRYLLTVPAADEVHMVFVSYLERAGDDRQYVSNEYRPADLAALAKQGDALQFGWGEELRHNFGAYGEGYGHALLLDLQELIRPVSLGPSLLGPDATDGGTIQAGLDRARAAGATNIWAHNDFGLEDIPDWVTQRLDAQNDFDGGEQTHYDATFYRYLDLGLHVPFSTGTDWFMFDLMRVYAKVAPPVTPKSWLAALRAGRSFITNEPLLFLDAGQYTIGDTIKAAAAGQSIRIKAHALGRSDFRRLELVYNGRVVHAVRATGADGRFEAAMDYTLELDEPGWFAVRIPWDNNRNALGQVLRAHTSPVYVEIAGRRRFDVNTARGLVAEMQESLRLIDARAKFANDGERQGVRRVYEDAIARLQSEVAAAENARWPGR